MNYYEVLEIAPGSSTEDIERAFKRLARKVHPDLNSGDPKKAEARMKQLNEIRDTLTDPLLRAGYDEGLRLDHERRKAAAPPPPAAQPAPTPSAAPTPSRFRARPMRPAPSRAPWLVLVMGLSATSALLWHWRRDLPWGAASVPAAAEPVPALPSPETPSDVGPRPPSAERPADATRPTRLKPRLRGLVRLGSSVDEVLRTFGTPDRIEPGKRSGDAVFVYGSLRLQITNGRVTSGDAAALH